MDMRKSTKARWTRKRIGTWTWNGYTAQRVWTYEGRESTHYYVWTLTHLGTVLGEYAILAQAKAAAAQRG